VQLFEIYVARLKELRKKIPLNIEDRLCPATRGGKLSSSKYTRPYPLNYRGSVRDALISSHVPRPIGINQVAIPHNNDI
jgi:hypothetical protein